MSKPKSAVSPVVTAFAHSLKGVLERSGLTYRQIAVLGSYSHAPLVRATRGDSLATWPVAKAILSGCGIDDLEPWYERWMSARNANHAFQLATRRGWSQMGIDATEPTPTNAGRGRASLQAASGDSDGGSLVQLLKATWSLKQLAQALDQLRHRNEQLSLRQIEELTGLPRTTLAGWFAGTHKPDADRLDELVAALGADAAERDGFALGLEQIAGPQVWNGQPIVTVDIGTYVGNGGYELWVTCSGDAVLDGRIAVAPGQSSSIMGVNNNPFDRTHGLSVFGETMATEAVISPTRPANRRTLLGLWISSPEAIRGKEIVFRCAVTTANGVWHSTPSARFSDLESIAMALRGLLDADDGPDDEPNKGQSADIVMDRFDY